MTESPRRGSLCCHPCRCFRLRELIVASVLVACPIGVSAAPGISQRQSPSSTASDFSTLSAAADTARAAGRLDEAVPLYRKALALRPDWKEGWWALGTVLYDQDSHAASADAFRRLLLLDPKNGTAHLMLALCEYQVDRDASAMEHIQAAKTLGVQKDGDLPHVLSYHEAMLLLRGGRFDRALEVLQSLVAARCKSRSDGQALDDETHPATGDRRAHESGRGSSSVEESAVEQPVAAPEGQPI